MKTNDQMPGDGRDYPESDISDNQKNASKQKPRVQSHSSQNNKDKSKGKGHGTYVKDMPEIVPARVGVI